MTILKAEEKLSINKFIVNKESHIILNSAICQKCMDRPCLNICPAKCFKEVSDKRIICSFEGCLECGSCRLICEKGAINWDFPEGGFGICYEYG